MALAAGEALERALVHQECQDVQLILAYYSC